MNLTTYINHLVLFNTCPNELDDVHITIKGTLDVHFNFISWDIYHFEQTFNL